MNQINDTLQTKKDVKHTHINLLFGCNDTYATYLPINLYAISSRTKLEVRAYLCYDRDKPYSEKNLEVFSNLEKKMPNLKIEFIPIDNKIFTSRNIKPFVPAAPYETYFKLLATDILEKEEERVLCLDTDAICVGNLEDIYFRDFGDSLIMGGYDVGINEDNYDTIVPEYYLNFSKIGITPFSYSEYVNCGGVLFNLANMRKLGKESDFLLEFASKYSEFGVVDQGVLNAAFHGQVSHFIVSESINVMFGEEVSTRKLLLSKDSKTILVQGIFTAKPWNMTRSFALGKKFWSIYDEYLNEVGALSFVYSWSNLKKFGLENRIVSLILPYCIMISLQKFLLLKKNGHKMSPECWQQSKR